jgi:acyl carrier protein
MIWLEAASQYRATHLQAPNFAFKLSARKLVTSDYDPPNGSKLDLSSVRHIINAAEPVDAGTIDAFQEAFAQFQLPRDVVFPTYGLAEHTVFVCSNGRARLLVDKEQLESHGRVVMVEDHNSGSGSTSTAAVTRLVGCGKPPASVTVRIVDPESHKLCNSADSTVGEIWIDSPSKAAGYYLKGEETRHDFHASLVVDGSDDGASAAHPPNNGFLRTGDLGFFYVGELFICGRIKDLIIVGGRNYYPQDLEATAEASEPNAVRPGCSAAFSIDPVSGGEGSGGEQVALVMELREVPKGSHQVEAVCSALADRIRGAINHEHALGVSVICFLQTRTVPKTSSGKIARSWCRKGYLNGTLQIVYRRSYAPATDPAPLEIEEANSGGVPLKSHAANGAIKPEEVARLRNMSRDEILAKLKTDVSRVASMPVDSVDKDAALVSMMDSLTLSQLKGLLERNYAVKLSDEYLFRESTTLQKLVDVVKLGYAPDDSDGGTNGEAAHAAHPHVPAPTPGRATGLAGALGCPPGVVCAIL